MFLVEKFDICADTPICVSLTDNMTDAVYASLNIEDPNVSLNVENSHIENVENMSGISNNVENVKAVASIENVAPVITPTVVPVSKFTITKIIPTRFKDYKDLPASISGASSSHTKCSYPLHNYVSYTVFSPQHQSFLTNVTITRSIKHIS